MVGRTSRRRSDRERFYVDQLAARERAYEVARGRQRRTTGLDVVARVICRQHRTTLASILRRSDTRECFLAIEPRRGTIPIDSRLARPIALRCPKCPTDKSVYPSQLRAAMAKDEATTVGYIRL